jgi:PHD/YefM family antitoxin component YafN of YafNO toxin-antitoxin module
MSKMNVYEIRTNGEKEWICASTLFECLKFYHGLNDLAITDFDDDDDVVLIPEEDWPLMNVIDTDETDETGEHPILHTFEQYMKTATSVDIIATTAY